MSSMTPRLVQMPKTATTALSAHVGQLHQHRPAAELARAYPGAPLLGVLREPLDWYRSWYAHVTTWEGSGNARCTRVIEALGCSPRPLSVPTGSSFRAVLWGLTHLDGVDRSALPAEDHLFAPGGLPMDGAPDAPGFPDTMWAAHVRHWFYGGVGGASPAPRRVVELLLFEDLHWRLGVEVVRKSANRPGDPGPGRWLEGLERDRWLWGRLLTSRDGAKADALWRAMVQNNDGGEK